MASVIGPTQDAGPTTTMVDGLHVALAPNQETSTLPGVVQNECPGKLDSLEIGQLDVNTASELVPRIACPEAQAVDLFLYELAGGDDADQLWRYTGLPVPSNTRFSVSVALKTIGYDGWIVGYGRVLREFPALPG